MSLIYTFESYRPPYPEKGTKALIWRGDFENNRDMLSPSTLYARDYYAENDAQALELGRQAAIASNAEFLGFADDEVTV